MAATVEFYLKVADNGLYVLDVAANASAPNGQGLTYFVNGVQVGQTNFPGVGDAGERVVCVNLTAGVRIPGASCLHRARAPARSTISTCSPAPSNPNADITVQSLDAGFYSDRLHFSWLDNHDASPTTTRRPRLQGERAGPHQQQRHRTAAVPGGQAHRAVRARQPGGLRRSGAGPGPSIDVTVLFNRAAYTPPTSK